MKTKAYSHILPFTGLIALLAAAALFVLLAVTAAAGPQADSLAYLPFVSGSPAPLDEYETDFSEDIEPWKAVRWQNGADFDVEHNGAGYLDVQVKSEDTYVIVSPLIAGPTATYDITFRAKLHDRQDKAQYGAIFGGDWQGAPCPGSNVDGCFNNYFELRVRYRDVNGEQYMEYRLRRVDGHDGSNIEQGKDLIEWERAEGASPDDWNKWEVHYSNRGHITVKVNNREQAESARDSKYTQNRYFGLFVKAGENGGTDASIDKFEIAKEN